MKNIKIKVESRSWCGDLASSLSAETEFEFLETQETREEVLRKCVDAMLGPDKRVARVVPENSGVVKKAKGK